MTLIFGRNVWCGALGLLLVLCETRVEAASPSAALPADVVQQCNELFAIGMADPRDGDYRAITIVLRTRTDWKTISRTIQTYGWVLRAPATEKERRAICWNGLVYPVVSVGAPADPAAQIRSLVAASGPWSADPMRPKSDEGVASDVLTILKIPLLVRLGENDLASQVWSQWKAFPGANLYHEQTAPANFFVVASREWIWGKFLRGRDEYLLAEAKVAAADLQDIPAARSQIEKIADRAGIKPITQRWPYQRSDSMLDLGFLDQAPLILKDEQRRLGEDAARRDEEYQPDIIPGKKERIFLLIRDLEDVEANPMSSPGYIDFGMSPIVSALARQGEDAVEPLLDCLEHDQRLTRTIDRGGANGFEANGPARIVGVEEPAFAALQAILQVDDQIPWLREPYVNGTPGGGDHLDRVALAQVIRAYWYKMRGEPVEMRWYQTLKDDLATSAAWAEAASNLTRPANEGYGYGGVMVFSFSTPGLPTPGGRSPLKGDGLRKQTAPAVGDLIARRLHDALARLPADKSPFRLAPPSRLAAALIAWDAGGQLTTLKWWCDYLKKAAASEGDSAGPGDMDDLTRAYLARIEAGDPTATSDYADWIHSLNTHNAFALTQLYGSFYFAPVYSYPDDPVIRKLTHWLFEEPDSPWSIGPKGIDPSWVAKCTQSGLVAVPAFRRLLLVQLKNQKIVGNVEITKNNVMVNFVYGSGDLITDPDTPSTGFKQDLRLCDMIANDLSKQAGFPRFQPYWPLEKRNAAVLQTIAFLEKYGDRVARKASSQELTLGEAPFTGPLHFDKLDHPATTAEAAEGRAIFSLEGQGERRLLPLLQIPQQANWTTLHDDLLTGTTYDDQGHASQVKMFRQECEIWQAEEVLVDGKWRRYYGLVAPHKLAMVPGEEIEILDPSAYEPMGNGWALRTDVGPQSDIWGKRKRFEHPVGDPVPITLWIRNMKGVEVPVPSPFDFTVSVLYTDQPYAFISNWTARTDVHWQPLSEKQPLKWIVQPHPNILDSLQSTEFSQFNAADYFDLSKPGSYRILVNLGPQKCTLDDFELTEKSKP